MGGCSGLLRQAPLRPGPDQNTGRPDSVNTMAKDTKIHRIVLGGAASESSVWILDLERPNGRLQQVGEWLTPRDALVSPVWGHRDNTVKVKGS